MYAARYGHVDLVELLLELGHEEEAISVVNIPPKDNRMNTAKKLKRIVKV